MFAASLFAASATAAPASQQNRSYEAQYGTPQSDAVRWLEVVGRVKLRNGVVCIEALQLTLARPDQLMGGGGD